MENSQQIDTGAALEKIKSDAEKLIKRSHRAIKQLNYVWWGPVIGNALEENDELYIKIFDLVFAVEKKEMEEGRGEDLPSDETDSRDEDDEESEDEDFVPEPKKRRVAK